MPPFLIVRAAFGVAVVTVLAACTSQQVASPPAHSLPDGFVEAVPAHSSVWPNQQWWRGFGSTPLNELIAEADRANADIAIETAAITAADAAVRVAGGALLPTAGLSAGANRQVSAVTKSPNSRYSNSFSTTLTASYEVDFWGRNHSLVEAASQTALASRFQRDTLVIATEASVADTWFTILDQQDKLRMAERNVAVAQHVLDVIKARHDVGTATALDLAQQENVLATQRAAVPAIQQTLATNRHALAILLGRLPEALPSLNGTLEGIKLPLVQPGLPSDLLKRRPDIQAADAQLASAQAIVVADRAALYPSITLTGSGGVASTALNTLFNPSSTVASLGAGLTQPILDGGLARATLDQQNGLYAEQVATYRKTVLTAFGDVEDALAEVADTTEQERLQGIVVDTAQRAQTIAEAQVREGTVDITSVLTAETTLFNAESTLADDRLNALKAIVALYQALGGGWVLESSEK